MKEESVEPTTAPEKLFPKKVELEETPRRPGQRRPGGLTNRTEPRLNKAQRKARVKSKLAKQSRKRNRV